MTAQVAMEYREDDPSYWRRKTLLSELGDDGGSSNGGIAVSSFFPITRYYEAADKVLAAFEEAVGRGDLDSTFVYGKRFCIFCIESIPKHNYYLSPKFQAQRYKYTKDAQTVMTHLEEVIQKMNDEERVKHKKRMEMARREAARREAERKRQEAIMREREKTKYQELMKRAELQKQNNSKPSPSANGGDVQASAMSKLEMLMKKPSASPAASAPPAAQPPKRPSGRYFLADTDDEEGDELAANGTANPSISVGEPLPPAMPPPPSYGDAQSQAHSRVSSSTGSLPPALSPPSTATSPTTATDTPPSYDFAINTQRHNPFLGPASGASYALPPPVQAWENVRPPSYNSVSGSSSLPDPPTKRYPTQPQQPPPQVKRKKKVPVRHLRDKARRRYNDLVQDGIIEIRPVDTYQGRYSQSTNGCTVISPLVVAHHLATTSGVVLPDREIKQVIDNECGPLLREIRGKLGLENHSLIIPSDVHDHLVDKNILKQDYFVGATGGNIISDEHMGEFIKLFKEKRKAGAALFFREHVVSIIKIPVGGGRAYYDLVDSMPGTKDARNNPCASRTRCKSEEALDVLLTWYATKKFSESNCSYIDNNDWNDNMADLDPRVFQAFVWGKDE